MKVHDMHLHLHERYTVATANNKHDCKTFRCHILFPCFLQNFPQVKTVYRGKQVQSSQVFQ